MIAFAAVTAAIPSVPRSAAGPSAVPAGWRQLLNHRPARGWLVGESLAATAWSGFLIYLGPFFGVTYAMRPSAIGLMLATAALAGVLGMLAAAPLAERFGRRPMLLASSLLAGLAIAVPLSPRLSPTLGLAALAPYIFLGCVRFPISSTIALSLLPQARGTMMAARGFIVAAAGMLGALISGVLLTTGGFGAIGMGCAALTLAGVLVYYRCIPSAC